MSTAAGAGLELAHGQAAVVGGWLLGHRGFAVLTVAASTCAQMVTCARAHTGGRLSHDEGCKPPGRWARKRATRGGEGIGRNTNPVRAPGQLSESSEERVGLRAGSVEARRAACFLAERFLSARADVRATAVYRARARRGGDTNQHRHTNKQGARAAGDRVVKGVAAVDQEALRAGDAADGVGVPGGARHHHIRVLHRVAARAGDGDGGQVGDGVHGVGDAHRHAVVPREDCRRGERQVLLRGRHRLRLQDGRLRQVVHVRPEVHLADLRRERSRAGGGRPQGRVELQLPNHLRSNRGEAKRASQGGGARARARERRIEAQQRNASGPTEERIASCTAI
eukprot:6890165-Pyramimonas_sp.AAC.4